MIYLAFLGAPWAKIYWEACILRIEVGLTWGLYFANSLRTYRDTNVFTSFWSGELSSNLSKHFRYTLYTASRCKNLKTASSTLTHYFTRISVERTGDIPFSTATAPLSKQWNPVVPVADICHNFMPDKNGISVSCLYAIHKDVGLWREWICSTSRS